jgi:hypothetical protein
MWRQRERLSSGRTRGLGGCSPGVANARAASNCCDRKSKAASYSRSGSPCSTAVVMVVVVVVGRAAVACAGARGVCPASLGREVVAAVAAAGGLEGGGCGADER